MVVAMAVDTLVSMVEILVDTKIGIMVHMVFGKVLLHSMSVENTEVGKDRALTEDRCLDKEEIVVFSGVVKYKTAVDNLYLKKEETGPKREILQNTVVMDN